MAELVTLLEVQMLDTQLDQLRHEHATTPERAAASDLEAQARTLEATLADARQARDAVLAAEKRLDDEAASIEAKASDADAKLYSGTITSPKELQALQADVEALRAHRSEIEDRELEVMEEREAHDATVRDLEAQVATVGSARDAALVARDARLAVLDEQIAAVMAHRAEVAATVSAQMLSEYERRRVAARGIGVARLVGGTCQGCRLTIPATEVDHMRHDTSGALHFCDNCGCILVVGE